MANDSIDKTIQTNNTVPRKNPFLTQTFSKTEEFEIGRDNGYALFPQLKESVNNGIPITITSFKNALSGQGISDLALQNKIICMILQKRAGIQHALNGAINHLVDNPNYTLMAKQQCELGIEVNNGEQVTLTYKNVLKDYSKTPKENALAVALSFTITPASVEINDIEITPISENEKDKKACQVLKDNEQDILKKITPHIKRLFDVATNSVDLRSLTRNLPFFSNIQAIKTEIKTVKTDTAYTQTFSESEEYEIGRGSSYALFPELMEDVDNDIKITTTSFRQALSTRKITDTAFQNKILCMVLQNKTGIYYPFGNVINNLLLNNGYQLLATDVRKISLEVNSAEQVTLTYKNVLQDYTTDPREDALSIDLSFAITPTAVVISNFNFTQISDNAEGKRAYQFLKANEQNILEKIIAYIKELFGFESEFKLETSNDKDAPWSSPLN